MKDSLSEMNNNNTQYIETLLRSRAMHRRFNLHTIKKTKSLLLQKYVWNLLII